MVYDFPGLNHFKLQLIIEITPVNKSSGLLQSHVACSFDSGLGLIFYLDSHCAPFKDQAFPILWRIYMNGYY